MTIKTPEQIKSNAVALYEFYKAVPPQTGSIHEQYRAIPAIEEVAGEWPRGTVLVQKKDAQGEWQQCYEYVRTYSMLRTFHPFRQLRDGSWHDYALISSLYYSFEVLDLEAGEVIAKRPHPVDKGGAEQAGWGFCPAEFYVPDWTIGYIDGYNDGEDLEDLKKEYLPPMAEEIESGSYYVNINEEAGHAFNHTGQWGVVSGCVWGDDSSYKVRYIDLSRIAEGIVTEDDRFGYVEIPPERLLSESVQLNAYNPDDIVINVPHTFTRETGSLRWPK